MKFLVGPSVLVPAHVAYRLSPALDRIAREARRSGVVVDGDLADVMAALQRAAIEHARVSEVGRTVERATSDAAESTSPPDLVTVAEAAVALGCTDRTVRRRLAAGQLSGLRAGRVWLVDRTTIEETTK